MDKESNVSEKSRTIALLLAFFLGWSGAHRFYVNKPITGAIMLFTMGGFGLWYFIDLVLISAGVLTDKDGLPLTKW
ncbi:MAG: TM2 domain-containing protein [Candidatus Magnetoovum sp. WYHC-5]|nr:TM2 domain-containing protein [Candidatus Magnetoovum sp. WYHC-5]